MTEDTREHKTYDSAKAAGDARTKAYMDERAMLERKAGALDRLIADIKDRKAFISDGFSDYEPIKEWL